MEDNQNSSIDGKHYPDILCCMCGVKIQSNPSNMCVNCLKSKVDISEGISKQVTIFFCRGCGRYQKPPWVSVELESRELLAICLKKIKGLNKEVKLIDASFVWTEPHSRRIKVKLTIQKEVYNAILQHTFVVDFIVQNQQCIDCQKSYTENTWTAVVQVRQKVSHKRTFYFLEQLLLKHNVCQQTLQVREMPDGLDFYWATKSSAMHFMEFLQSVVPIRTKQARRLISEDDKNNLKLYKFTLFAEIAPICKDDLVCLDNKLAFSLGGVCPLMLCYRVTANLHFIDPVTLKIVEISGGTFWHHPFPTLMSVKQLIEFTVLDIETSEESNNEIAKLNNQSDYNSKNVLKFNSKLLLTQATVAKSSDLGVNDTTYITVTHLGNILKPGDLVLGYDLGNAVLSDEVMKPLKNRNLPDIILVRKVYARKKNRSRRRNWKLKHMNIVADEKEKKKGEMEKDEEEKEKWMDMVEEDEDLRRNMNLYKDADIIKDLEKKKAMKHQQKKKPSDPKENKEEKKNQGKPSTKKKKPSKKNATEMEESDEESDYEQGAGIVKLDELLDDLDINKDT